MTSSTPDLARGAGVRHAEHGPGRVLDVLRGGRAALVRFERFGSLPIQVAARELVVTEAAPAPPPRPSIEAADAGALPEPALLQLLEALRLGTVPADGLDVYTVGREAELAQVDADLAEVRSKGGSARVVLGEYGTGKTHLLECIAARARAAGFLVAKTALDPVDVPASNPRRVYRALMHRLTYPAPETGIGLWPLLERARFNPEVQARFHEGERHPHLTPALDLLERLDADEAGPLCDWLEGAPQDFTPELNRRYRLWGEAELPALMDYRPWAHIYAHLISGLAALAERCDYAGLVLLLDEAEMFRVLDSENREFAERLFRALMSAALPASALPFDPAQEPRGGRGEMKVLPHRWVGRCPLYVVMAMTPTTGHHERLVAGLVRPDRLTDLSPLSPADYRTLAGQVIRLYGRHVPRLAARADALSSLIGDLIRTGLADGSFGTPRVAVKFVMELLDLSRWSPDKVRTAIEEVKRLWY